MHFSQKSSLSFGFFFGNTASVDLLHSCFLSPICCTCPRVSASCLACSISFFSFSLSPSLYFLCLPLLKCHYEERERMKTFAFVSLRFSTLNFNPISMYIVPSSSVKAVTSLLYFFLPSLSLHFILQSLFLFSRNP